MILSKHCAPILPGLLALGCTISGLLPAPAAEKGKAEKSNMELVGYNDLQARSAYQPVIEKQGDRWIAYVGHHAGVQPNALTGKDESNGTSVVDVTDPKHPKYIAHIPGEPIKPGDRGDVGGAQMVRVCAGSELPRADKNKFYLLRSFGNTAHEIWDVTDPARPTRVNTIVSGLRDTHKSWWECDTGIAYLIGGAIGWRTPRMAILYDLSDPAKPVFIRNFGLPGQQPGAKGPTPESMHGPVSTGPKGNRVYFAYGNSRDGVLEIVDREKLLKGAPEPTDENLRYPVVGRVDFPEDVGVHNVVPLLQMQVPEFAKQKNGKVKDFVAVVGETVANECAEYRQTVRFLDITDESKPVGVSMWTVPEASGNFCSAGGRFGAHSSNENFTPVYNKRVLFIAHFNAGVRAVDVRDPFHPKEIAYYIPAITDKTDKRCAGKGADEHCKIAIQTNNVEVDDRGYIYAVDRANTGMHILALTGPARQAADFTALEHH
ncbi:MAG: hypothetical protein JO307_06655 [Bryobacterales bacterium]|nr:hypothetical protein [Bryobacterales bacterium]MBV9398133.1 hypothetical protein [Bryobacterales bacterium]